ncbi:beta-lactamase [Colletotrichum karsti]|uniref:Beta-lactamase n=1 Tax=Colletotrichum karsti TaxID=1095194 RepID=A0A9P6ICE3_9PEZI|nr:beta-lactamase [Colletotrichum karsti]KAF9880293.1 beta-lactamase [Colletotrichum karsti]
MLPRSLLAITALLAGTRANPCPPTGHTLPTAKSPSNSTLVRDTLLKIQDSLANLTSSDDLNGTGIAIGIKSIHEDAPLFELYHTPAIAEISSTKEVNIDTVFRGGSITKLFTVLTALQNSHIKGSDPVTKYLPRLKEDALKAQDGSAFNVVPWDNITVEDLVTHLSGIGGDTATDLANFESYPWKAMGLPAIANETRPRCSGLGGTKPCTADDLFSALNKKPLVFKPHTTPIYSNLGISLLSLVVEAATNKTYDSVLTETILKPLGLTNTSSTGPDQDSWGFIPKDEPTWRGDAGIYTAAGGIYTNTRDMLTFGTAILSNNLTIDTSSWLKPRAFTTSSGYSVGAPWEILTSTTLLPSGVPISIYTKSGDLGLYSNLLLLVPDYDLTISILTAGPASTQFMFPARVISPVISALIPALEQANKDAAKTAFAGTYTDPETNSTVTLSIDDGPGLSLTDLKIRGVPVLPNIPNYSTSITPGKTYNVSARLYPTNIKEGEKWSWRAVYKNHNETDIDDDLFYPQGGCLTWGLIDRNTYNYLAFDDFVVTVGEDEVAKSISPRAFSVILKKVVT